MRALNVLPSFVGISYSVSPWVPLTRTDPDTGEVSDALCWMICGNLVIHPLRLAQLKQAITRQGIELARRADDGGAP